MSRKLFSLLVDGWKAADENDWHITLDTKEKVEYTSDTGHYVNIYQYLEEKTEELKEETKEKNLFVSKFEIIDARKDENLDTIFQLVYQEGENSYVRIDYSPEKDIVEAEQRNGGDLWMDGGINEGRDILDHKLKEKRMNELVKLIDEMPEYRLVKITKA